ncbi:hypothetical protein ACUXAU_001072 [Staphylococcus caprae]
MHRDKKKSLNVTLHLGQILLRSRTIEKNCLIFIIIFSFSFIGL